MTSDTFYINPALSKVTPVEYELSFEPFIRYLKERIKTEKTIKLKLYEFILDTFEAYTANVAGCIDTDNVKTHQQLLELMFAALSPAIVNEQEYLWALGTPVPNKVFYSTDAFRDFAITDLASKTKTSAATDAELLKQQHLDYIYRLILKRLYNFTSALNSDIYYTRLNAGTGLYRYYKIHADTTFIDIEVKGSLPELTFEHIEPYLHNEAGAEALMEVLPLSLFKFKGFAVITLNDVTARHAIDEIRDVIISHNTNDDHLYEQVIQLLKTLTEDPAIEFGLMPLLKLNGTAVYDAGMCTNSILMQAAQQYGDVKSVFKDMAERYELHPKAVYYPVITPGRIARHPYLGLLKQAGVCSYARIPLLYHRHLAGMLEVYAYQGIEYTENLLSKVDFALPLLAQMVQNSIERFNVRIDQVIKENFTSLQPSVLWKFNEAAWNYIRQEREHSSGLKIETVAFKEVYPLYGAIDIRNSTMERNTAMQMDLHNSLTSLLTVINRLDAYIEEKELSRLIKTCNQWIAKIEVSVTASDKIRIDSFLNQDVPDVLLTVKRQHTDAAQLVDEFLATANITCEGPVYAHQHQLETSIRLINTSINKYFEREQQQLESIYPCYFEKFRTDGVEYDIYAGQAIAPGQPFSQDILSAIRLWQLTSMVAITRLTQKLQQQMPVKLQTTQLVFIHSSAIDINFRNDERRFDVEGVYNIRYEVIKKRIDKVRLKDSNERLTQPDKIALVYLTRAEADEYKGYIGRLQQQQMLTPGIEELELEELQDVKGLKALRVSVRYE